MVDGQEPDIRHARRGLSPPVATAQHPSPVDRFTMIPPRAPLAVELDRRPAEPKARPHSVVLVSAVAPVPVDNGKRAVLKGMVEYFVDRLGAENVHYAMVAGAADAMPDLPCQVHRLSRPSTSEQLLQGAKGLLTSRRGTLQEALLNSRRLKRDIADLLGRLGCDLHIYDTVRLGQHRTAGKQRNVVYMDDLFSQRYQRILDLDGESRAADFDPLGEFAANVPAALRPALRRPSVYRPLLAFEARRLRKREVELAQDFDAALLISSTEVDLLRQRSGSSRVSRLSPLLPDVLPLPRAVVDPPEFVFLGRLNIPHNDDGICSFLQLAGPELSRRWPGAKVRIVGSGPSPALQRLAAEQSDLVVLEGFVRDLNEVFSRATALIAPLRFGSGVKIKVIDALARGLPVIGTSSAFEGIDVRPDLRDGCLVEDDVRRWPDALTGLVGAVANRRASRAALAYYLSACSRSVVLRQYDEIFGMSG